MLAVVFIWRVNISTYVGSGLICGIQTGATSRPLCLATGISVTVGINILRLVELSLLGLQARLHLDMSIKFSVPHGTDALRR